MSTTASAFPVPSGQYPPFAVVTDTDHTAWIIIATALCLSQILLFIGIKILIRRTACAIMGLDELSLAASTITAVIQSSIVLAACSKGLGQSIELLSEGNLIKTQQMYYVSILFFVMSLGLSKASVAFLLLRLTPSKIHRRVFYVIVAVIAIWTVASTFAVALQCNLPHPWILMEETCHGAFLRWQLISVFDIATELCLVGMSIYLVWSLQTSLENKLAVAFSFGMRLPLIIVIAYRLANFNIIGLTTNPTLLQDKFIIWTQTELSYSIIAATIPSLRPFIRTLSTNYGTATANGYGSGGYGSAQGNGVDGDTQQSSTYQMSNLRPKGKGDAYKYRIWSGGNDGDSKVANKTDADSKGSSDSQRMIIKKHLSWGVEAEVK